MPITALLALAAAASRVGVSDLQAFQVRDGVNEIVHLSPDGRDGIIVSGAHSGSLTADGASRDYVVLLNRREGEEIVDAEPVPSLVSDVPFGGELLSAAPHTGEDWKRVVRFARGRVDGAPATLMVLAERDMRRARTAYTAVRVQITYFALRRDPEIDADRFVPIGGRWSQRCYVDANLALKDEIKLPLPPDYAGPTTANPCGSG